MISLIILLLLYKKNQQKHNIEGQKHFFQMMVKMTNVRQSRQWVTCSVAVKSFPSKSKTFKFKFEFQDQDQDQSSQHWS